MPGALTMCCCLLAATTYVAFPITCADFLAIFKMTVDLFSMQLLCPAGLKAA